MMGDDDHERSRDRQRGGGGRRDRPTRFSSTERDRSADRGGGRDRGGGGMKSSNNRVYVSNIPYEYRWQDLKDLFRQQVGEVAFVELFVDENDKARGCGIVEFADASSAKKCLEVMHRYDLKGRKMVIKEDYGNKRDKYGNLIGNKSRRDDDRDRSDRGGGGGGGGGGSRDMMDRHSNMGSGGGGGSSMPFNGNTYGLSSAFLEDLNIQTPLNSRIFVANLDYKVDKKKLKEVFRLAGKVLYVDMPLAKDGTSRGFAVVEFDHPVEAVQAISMFQGQALYERAMTVRMDRGSDREKLPEGLKSVGPGLGSNGEALRDVARNLPTVATHPMPMVAATATGAGIGSGGVGGVNSGAGILGAVPNLQLGGGGGSAAANALNSLSSAAVLQQAAQLGLSNNLLGGPLGAANLLQGGSSLAALAAAGGANSLSGGGGSGVNSFGRGGDGHDSGGGRFMSSNSASMGGSGGGYDGGGGQTNVARNSYSTGGYDSKPPGGFGTFDGDKAPGGSFGGFNSGDRDRYSMNNGGNQMMRNSMNMVDRKKSQLLISNLPPSAQYKLITEKCQEFGAVVRFEEQGVGTLLVTFQTEWDAEQAMKNIDRARIDGRTIDAQII